MEVGKNELKEILKNAWNVSSGDLRKLKIEVLKHKNIIQVNKEEFKANIGEYTYEFKIMKSGRTTKFAYGNSYLTIDGDAFLSIVEMRDVFDSYFYQWLSCIKYKLIDENEKLILLEDSKYQYKNFIIKCDVNIYNLSSRIQVPEKVNTFTNNDIEEDKKLLKNEIERLRKLIYNKDEENPKKELSVQLIRIDPLKVMEHQKEIEEGLKNPNHKFNMMKYGDEIPLKEEEQKYQEFLEEERLEEEKKKKEEEEWQKSIEQHKIELQEKRKREIEELEEEILKKKWEKELKVDRDLKQELLKKQAEEKRKTLGKGVFIESDLKNFFTIMFDVYEKNGRKVDEDFYKFYKNSLKEKQEEMKGKTKISIESYAPIGIDNLMLSDIRKYEKQKTLTESESKDDDISFDPRTLTDKEERKQKHEKSVKEFLDEHKRVFEGKPIHTISYEELKHHLGDYNASATGALKNHREKIKCYGSNLYSMDKFEEKEIGQFNIKHFEKFYLTAQGFNLKFKFVLIDYKHKLVIIGDRVYNMSITREQYLKAMDSMNKDDVIDCIGKENPVRTKSYKEGRLHKLIKEGKYVVHKFNSNIHFIFQGESCEPSSILYKGKIHSIKGRMCLLRRRWINDEEPNQIKAFERKLKN